MSSPVGAADGSVHSFDLAVGPGAGLCEALLDLRLGSFPDDQRSVAVWRQPTRHGESGGHPAKACLAAEYSASESIVRFSGTSKTEDRGGPSMIAGRMDCRMSIVTLLPPEFDEK